MANTTTLTITERVAKLGKKITTTANPKDSDAPKLTVVQLDGLFLDEAEFDALVGRGAHKAFFREAKVGKVKQLEPRFPILKAIELDGDYVGDVTFDLDDLRIECDDEHVTITDVKIELKSGGLTVLSVKVECSPSREERGSLEEHLLRECRAEVTFGGARKPKSKKQVEMPLGPSAHPDPDATNGTDAEASASTH